ncbi:unnamed protein product [Urochloa humidicola]
MAPYSLLETWRDQQRRGLRCCITLLHSENTAGKLSYKLLQFHLEGAPVSYFDHKHTLLLPDLCPCI